MKRAGEFRCGMMALTALGLAGSVEACIGADVAPSTKTADAGSDGAADSAVPPVDSGPNVDPVDDGGGVGDAEAGGAPKKRIFVTNAVHTGNFGGITGLDNFCQAAASTAGASGQFMAFASTSIAHAIDRLPSDGPWYSMDEQTLLFTGKTTGAHPIAGLGPNAPLNQNEFAQSFTDANIYYWTGSQAGGLYKDQNNCADFTNDTTSNFKSGSVGSIGATDGKWVDWGTSYVCYAQQHVLCFEK